jgi:hypothetical protein
MARRMLRSLMIGAVVGTSLLLGAGPAMADQPPNSDNSGQDNSTQQRGNPQTPNNPYAIPFTGQGGGCVMTYNAPPAEGAPPAGSNAAGGNPGWVYTGSHGNNC